MVLSFEALTTNKYQFSYNGVPSGEYVEVTAHVFGEEKAQWTPDAARSGFYKRVDPLIRFAANIHVPRRFRGCNDQWELIAVSWSKEPTPGDYAWDIYQADLKSNRFIGITKSISRVRTAAKRWMLKKIKQYNAGA